MAQDDVLQYWNMMDTTRCMQEQALVLVFMGLYSGFFSQCLNEKVVDLSPAVQG